MSERFDIGETTIPGVYVLERMLRADERGWLERMYSTEDLSGVLGTRRIVQVNRTFTRLKGSVRGLHYQVQPSAEAKIVSCLRGAAFDVAVDLRRDSATFLTWHAETLTADNHRSLFIPEGFAHGFQALADDCELLYFHSAAFDPAAERGLHPHDPRLAIAWPLPVEHLSERDASHSLLAPDFDGMVI
ncbi:MAG: dTDP-4-dehydrorhamnose 3,5-epimerase family protein [Chloroflexota bacterium]|nr:dTDP-4-dehydrorhamnose 3,5-epimerase family protein [Chloroflexota bacterium]